MNINNFTEFYTLLKGNDSIVKSIPSLSNFIILTESYRGTCSCNRRAEKIRLKEQCETEYKNAVINILTPHAPLILSILKQNKIKFLFGGNIFKEFNV
jgi:hypothetical protein